MHVVILGAGGVGGYLGARLISAGADVVFLVRENRAARLDAQGLLIESPLGEFAARVKVMTSVPRGLAADLVILACKAYRFETAIDEVAPLIGPETRVLPILNGVRHLDVLSERHAANTVAGGVVHGALNLRDDGVIDHLTPFLSVIAGAASGDSDPVVDNFVGALTRVHVDARVSRDIRRDMWDKFVFLTTLAGMTCLMRASIGAIVETGAGRDLILQLLEECLAVARAEGRQPAEASMAQYRALLTQRGSAFTSSMLRDIEGGRRTEAGHILGDMLMRAQTHGVSTPLLRVATAHLSAYERRFS